MSEVATKMRPHWELAAAVMLAMNGADPRILNERGAQFSFRVRAFHSLTHCVQVAVRATTRPSLPLRCSERL